MNSVEAFIQEMLVLYGMAILGFIVRKKGILNENANNVLTQLILNITLPALILFSLDISFSFTLLKDFLWLVSLSVYILTLYIFLAIWMRRCAILPEKQKSVYEGLIIFVLPIRLPHLISSGLETVGKMTIPLSMMMIGMLIANVKNKDMILFIKNIYLWKSALIKLLIIPLLLLPFVTLSVPFPILVIAVLVSGMPSAPTISLYSEKFGADSSFASLGVLLTTILCIITLPFLYFVLTLF